MTASDAAALPRPHPGVILPVQSLRALAALLVVFAHANDQLRPVGLPYDPKLGHFGVDVFFVISGFIMFLISEQRRPGARTFLFDRFTRIAPNYWLYTTVVAILAVTIPAAFRGTQFTGMHYIQSLLFIAHPDPAEPSSTSPLLQLGWTLNYEMFFYAIFAVALWVSFKHRLLIICSVLAVLALAGAALEPDDVVGQFYTATIMLEFAFGMLIGRAYTTRSMRTLPSGVMLIAASAAIVWAACTVQTDAAVTWRGIVWGVPAAALLLATLLSRASEGRAMRMMHRLGDASYTNYLFYLVPLSAMRLAWLELGLPTDVWGNYVFVSIALAVTCLGGFIAYSLVERPLTKAFRLATRSRSRSSAGTLHARTD